MNYIISIINPDSLSILMDLCNQLDLPLSITMAGRGTAVQSMLDLLGIESNERRIVFTVANEEKTKKLNKTNTNRCLIIADNAQISVIYKFMLMNKGFFSYTFVFSST